MSRIMGFIITLLYVAGGLVLGYYGHMLRIATEAQLTTSAVIDFHTTNPYGLGGLALILIAILFHRGAINKARRLDKQHRATEQELTADRDECVRMLETRNLQMGWVELAIERAVHEDRAAAEKVLEGSDRTP